MRRLVLATSLLTSIATSQAVPDARPGEATLTTGVVVTNHGEEQVALGVAFATEPSCELLLEHPWLSTGVGFAEGVVLLVPAGGEVPLLDVLGSSDGQEIPACYVARLTLDDEVAVALVGTDRALYGPSPVPGAPADRLDIAVHPGTASVFVDAGIGLLQDAGGLEICEVAELPSWTPLEVEDVEGFVEQASREGDCIELIVDQERFSLCGVEGLEIDVGAPVRIHATEAVLDLDVFDGPRVVAGQGLEQLGLEGEVQLAEGLCAATLDCGGVTDGLVRVGEELLGAGDGVELDGGRLTVLAADVPLQAGCASGAEILYLRR